MSTLALQLGVNTDPVQYRFSYEWLFRLLAEEGVRTVQLGTFFEVYQLPDEFFHRLRRRAEDQGIAIHSIFTAHRELGGFFIDEPGWEAVARRNYERLIEVGALVGARSVGSNPGAVYRDRMGTKPRGVARYLRHMKELMGFAHQRGVEWLTVEPMSCLAEPPTLPDAIRTMADELDAYHREHPDSTARIGYCTDVAHGDADAEGRVVHNHLDRTLTEIRRLGMQPGVALNPATPLSALEYVLERLDFVLLMTVNPGFAGQKLVAGAIRKIADCRRLFHERGLRVPIMVDGNVSVEHIPRMVGAGADILVAGTSSWFHGDGSLRENVAKTEQAIAAGLEMRKQ